MLSDRAKICARGGHGGNGCVSFRREKYVPRGGPDGGDGGRGGDVALVAGEHIRDLTPFLQTVHYSARAGAHGSGARRHGANGPTLRVEVPPGTEVRTLDGELLADLVQPGAAVAVARGGEGGRGNTCFASSTRRAPHFAERGLPGEERWLLLRMKLLADVGLVGLPNAGKSSLLAALTRARPKVAAYPFTTIEPNLGVLNLPNGRALVLADIPGLVEGASRGVGLGDQFLAHVERTRALLYVVDGSLGVAAASSALRTVREELQAFEPGLVQRACAVVVSKIDLCDKDAARRMRATLQPELRRTLGTAAVSVSSVSSVTGDGLDELVETAAVLVPEVVPQQESKSGPVVLRPGGERVADFTIQREGGGWRICGFALERLVAKADMANNEAVEYLQQVMEHAGVSTALRRAGCRTGDRVAIGDQELDFD
jgi:GTP-binding protein